MALFRVAPPAVSNNERDFGLYSHCLGVGYLLSRSGSVVFFGSSGTETVVVVVQDQMGIVQSNYCSFFLLQLPKLCTIMSLAHMYLVTRQKKKLRTQGI